MWFVFHFDPFREKSEEARKRIWKVENLGDL